MFLTGQALATNPVVCWANADIIFTGDLMRAATVVAARMRPKATTWSVAVPDLDQLEPIEFHPTWESQIVDRVHTGRAQAGGMDLYFMFTRGLFDDLPPFAIGRPGYDQWLIWRAADLGADVIDATDAVLAVHQRHDYSHVGTRAAVFGGVEAQRNAAIVDDWRHYHSISYAARLGPEGRVRPARGVAYRMACDPPSYVAHWLRFTRSWRRRMLGEQATRSTALADAPAGTSP